MVFISLIDYCGYKPNFVLKACSIWAVALWENGSATQDMAFLLLTNLVSFLYQGNLTKCSHYALQTTLTSTNFHSS